MYGADRHPEIHNILRSSPAEQASETRWVIQTDPEDPKRPFARQGPVDGLHVFLFSAREGANAYLSEPDVPASARVLCLELPQLLGLLSELDQEVYTDVVTDPRPGPDWFDEKHRADLDDFVHLLLGLVSDLRQGPVSP